MQNTEMGLVSRHEAPRFPNQVLSNESEGFCEAASGAREAASVGGLAETFRFSKFDCTVPYSRGIA